jgi:hypothetical protein
MPGLSIPPRLRTVGSDGWVLNHSTDRSLLGPRHRRHSSSFASRQELPQQRMSPLRADAAKLTARRRAASSTARVERKGRSFQVPSRSGGRLNADQEGRPRTPFLVTPLDLLHRQ